MAFKDVSAFILNLPTNEVFLIPLEVLSTFMRFNMNEPDNK